MKIKLLLFTFSISIFFIGGCSSSKNFPPIPKGLDISTLPKQTIEMTAERFHFTPDEIHVKMGTLVHINIKSLDGTHGFKLGDFGIDETIDEGQTKAIEFYAQQKGEYGFHCSHFCGLGHLSMSGKVIVD